MKRLFIILLLGLLIFSSCKKEQPPLGTPGATPAQNITPTPTKAQPQHSVSEYFPLKKDVHMVYKGTGNEFAEFETYVEYIKDNTLQLREINPGTSLVNVYQLTGGTLKRVYRAPETYYRYDFTSLKGDEEVLIKEPIEAGTQWALKDGAKRSITAVDKDVSTPLGSYKALEITTENPESATYEYYAKDIGLIKRVFKPKNSSFTVTSEIEKIETDVPFKHTVRFYFPDFLNDRVVYMDRSIDIFTNQDMKFKFQKELKTIPEGSKLTKVLTPNVEVLGSVVEKDKGLVTVNFSPQLVNEMNAGTSLESMIIKSIVNTFGRYYQADKVIITVDGKPYSSGHILLKSGEYFNVNTEGTVPYKN